MGVGHLNQGAKAFSVDMGSLGDPISTENAVDSTVDACPCRRTTVRPGEPSGRDGGYVVQVSSQRSEEDALASYRALQSRFPDVLGSHAPIIKRADLGDKGAFYRAVVGPFATSDEAAQFCSVLRTAGGYCIVQKN